MDRQVRNRICWIRAILCFMVVTVHARNTDWFRADQVPWIAQCEDILTRSFAYIGVAGFFFISGYLFFRNFRPEDLINKLRRRIHTLVIPFLFWNLMIYLLYLICSVTPVIKLLFAGKDISLSAQDFIDAVFFYKYNPVFWFMEHLIIFMALTPLIDHVTRKRAGGIIAVILVFLLGIRMYYHPLGHGLHVIYPYVLSGGGFLFGCHCGRHEHALFEQTHIPWGICAISALLPFILTGIFIHNGNIYALQLMRTICGACLMIAAANIHFPAPAFWFRYTFFIYAAHQLTLSLINKCCAVLICDNMYFGGLLFCVLPFAAVWILALIASFIETHMPPVSFLAGISHPQKKSS